MQENFKPQLNKTFENISSSNENQNFETLGTFEDFKNSLTPDAKLAEIVRSYRPEIITDSIKLAREETIVSFSESLLYKFLTDLILVKLTHPYIRKIRTEYSNLLRSLALLKYPTKDQNSAQIFRDIKTLDSEQKNFPFLPVIQKALESYNFNAEQSNINNSDY